MNTSRLNERMKAIFYGAIAAWQLVGKRTLAHWRLLSYVMIGVVLASAILAGTVIYFEALRELALKNSLERRTSEELDITLQATRGPTDNDEYSKVASVVDSLISRHLAWMLRDRLHAGKTPTFFLATPGNEDHATESDDRTFFAFIQDLDQRAPLGAGAPASLGIPVGAGQPLELEALILSEGHDEFGARVGDRFVAIPSFTSAIPQVNVTITGIASVEASADSEFAHFTDEVLQSKSGAADLRVMPFFVSQRAFLEVLGPSIGRLSSMYYWFLETDANLVTADNAELTVANIQVLNRRAAAELQPFSLVTRLDDALIEYDRRLFFSKLPMFIVLILIALVILYYVATMSSLVVDNQRSEVALFRSRGSDSTQVLTVFVLEGATIALIAVIVAPIVAAIAISLLGLTPAFSGLTGGSLLSVEISPTSYALGAVGGVMSFVALMIPAVQASRFGITQQRQQSSRPSALPAFQRYYLDVLLLVVAIFLFRQLTEQGSVVARDVFGETTADELLLAVPGLILVASAMVLLRLFPLTMRLISKLFARVLPAAPAMTVWQMSRDPTHYARLSLLLILTAGLGIFASSFSTTLETSFKERILHSTGSDVRLSGVTQSSASLDPIVISGGRFVAETAYEQIPGVNAASAVFRSPGRDLTNQTGGSLEFIALNSTNFDDVAWFRDDFSAEPLGDLLSRITVADTAAIGEGIEIPADVQTIGARVRADRISPTIRVVARLRNAIDQQINVPVGLLTTSDWMDLEVPLMQEGREEFLANGPLQLTSIYVEQSNLRIPLKPGSLLVDDVRVTTANGQTVFIERFDTTDRWSLLKTTEESLNDELHPSEEMFDDMAGAALFTWAGGEALTARGIFVGEEAEPIRVLASQVFLDHEAHTVGDEFEISLQRARIPLRIVGIVELFPTITSDLSKYLIADLAALNAFTTSAIADRPFLPEDLWISSVTAGRDRDTLLDDLQSVQGFNTVSVLDRQERFQANDASVDPLVDAGWRALLFIAFSAVLVLSCLGFLVHVYSSFRNRQVQFALMRTVGLSGGQLTAMMWLEQFLVIAVGLALGTWMGSRLGATIMPFLGHDDFGGKVIPPFVMVIDWGALLITYAAMLVVFAVITLGLILLIRRISLSRVLRLGEQG